MHTLPAPTMTPSVIADVIDAAAQHLASYGLLDGDLWPMARDDDGVPVLDSDYPDGGSTCTVGAVAVALGMTSRLDAEKLIDEPREHPVMAALMHHLCAVGIDDVLDWSDSARQDQVVDRLRSIAADIRRAAQGVAA